MAQRLIQFLSWCERSGKDWREVNYEDLHNNWLSELMTGTLSSNSKPLTNATVNIFVSEAMNFLTWAADLDLRAPFKVPPMALIRKRLKTFERF